jgi:hypothetical protein
MDKRVQKLIATITLPSKTVVLIGMLRLLIAVVIGTITRNTTVLAV